MEENKMDIINKKRNKIKLLKILDVSLATLLTFVGNVSILDFLIFLNVKYQISYFSCFVLTLILPNIYSFFANTITKPIDDMIILEKKELSALEEDNKLLNDQIISKIELRFEGLPREKKMVLLKYIKESTLSMDMKDKIEMLETGDVLTLLDKCEEISSDVLSGEYTRKKKM